MKVRDAMTQKPVTVGADAPVREAAALMRTNRVGGLPVIEENKVIGMITESDIISLLETGRISDDLWLPSPLEIIEIPIREFINWEKTRTALSSIGDRPVRTVMSHPAIAIRGDAEIEDAAELMIRHRIARVPVIDEGRLVGIIARADIVRVIGTSAGTGES
jgi:CBS domain-containing protein